MNFNIQLLSVILMDRPSSLLTALQNKVSLLLIVTKCCLKYFNRPTDKVITEECSVVVEEFLFFMEMH